MYCQGESGDFPDDDFDPLKGKWVHRGTGHYSDGQPVKPGPGPEPIGDRHQPDHEASGEPS